jgi:hypothetical protein
VQFAHDESTDDADSRRDERSVCSPTPNVERSSRGGDVEDLELGDYWLLVSAKPPVLEISNAVSPES